MSKSEAIENLKQQGLIDSEQELQLTEEQKKIAESLTDEEIRILKGIKQRSNQGAGPMTDGNIIF